MPVPCTIIPSFDTTHAACLILVAKCWHHRIAWHNKMQGNREASFGCLKANASQGSGNSIEGFPEPKDEKVNYSGDSIKSGNPMIWEASPPPNQGYPRPFYRQEILTWPYIYPDYQVLRQSQPHAVENHFYHMNRDYSFPVENRIQYVPYKLFSQEYPHDVQLQEFQYFVVIDFEATCDKDTNPHPQEIIEFPSVLVNSVTGQLEASFQTYVRPAYHQLLTDFCKELTGIQQIQVDQLKGPIPGGIWRHALQSKGGGPAGGLGMGGPCTLRPRRRAQHRSPPCPPHAPRLQILHHQFSHDRPIHPPVNNPSADPGPSIRPEPLPNPKAERSGGAPCPVPSAHGSRGEG
ncbi:uncharacterized protein LOC109708820 isoform X4 [Ananas comosus]|uniref:Uncharacterized protein LOC109708820 isoform X4 n=1 Tax=Ananas comosus TaxID=4615 RepID=A0A6P5EYI7_ANACO|nr:uncharacterized protein LOC109708820 isoform X4 [Ananas comosus]